jgi:hypothetical protein
MKLGIGQPRAGRYEVHAHSRAIGKATTAPSAAKLATRPSCLADLGLLAILEHAVVRKRRASAMPSRPSASAIAGKSPMFTTVRFPLGTLPDAPLPTLSCRLSARGWWERPYPWTIRRRFAWTRRAAERARKRLGRQLPCESRRTPRWYIERLAPARTQLNLLSLARVGPLSKRQGLVLIGPVLGKTARSDE